jgi:hypothetical protein
MDMDTDRDMDVDMDMDMEETWYDHFCVLNMYKLCLTL